MAKVEATPLPVNEVLARIKEKFSYDTNRAYEKNLRLILKELNVDIKSNPTVDIRPYFNNIDNIIGVVNAKWTGLSTRKSYYSTVLAILNMFQFPVKDSKKVQKLISNSAIQVNLDTHLRSKLPEMNKPLSEAQAMMDNLQTKYNQLIENLDNSKYSKNNMFAAFLHLILNYGVLRANELVSLVRLPNNVGNIEVNHVLPNGEIFIYDHKTVKSIGTRSFKTDRTFARIIKNCDGNLFTNEKGGSYANAQGLEKRFFKEFGLRLYDVRKAKVSLMLATKDIKKIKRLEMIQGHSIKTMMTHYHVHANNDMAGAEEKE